jgi:LPXTG-site transpeptidase (sortase) family protein
MGLSRTLIASVSIITLGLAFLLGALAFSGTEDKPAIVHTPSGPAVFTGKTRTVFRKVPGIPTPVPVPVSTPIPTPPPPPPPTPVPTQLPTPEPTPDPTPTPIPEPVPEPTPTLEPTPPSVPPDLVLTKETFLAGRLLIPDIGVDAPFEEKGLNADDSMEDPSGREAVAWYPFKSLPNGGENIFLAGHLQIGGTPAVFNKVPDLEVGDRLVILAGGVEFYYSVISRELLTKDESIHAVNDPVDAEVVTLMTCGGEFIPETGDYTHRWIVRAARIN